MVITFTFKVDEFEEAELVTWLRSFKKPDRVRSYHIRQALKAYIKGGAVSSPVFPVVPVLSGNPPGPGAVPPPLVLETGEIITENPGQRQEKNEAELLALLDSQF